MIRSVVPCGTTKKIHIYLYPWQETCTSGGTIGYNASNHCCVKVGPTTNLKPHQPKAFPILLNNGIGAMMGNGA